MLTGQRLGMARTQTLATNCQGTAEEHLGREEIAELVQQRRQIVEALSGVGMTLPQSMRTDLQRLAEPHLGRRRVAAREVQPGQPGQGRRQVWVVRATATALDVERALIHLLG